MSKKLLFLFLMVGGILALTSCDDDDQVMEGPEYSIMIMQPSTEDKKVNDSIHIHVEFSEASNQTVHHVNVKIYDKNDESKVIFDAPGEAHVHAEGGSHAVHADLELSEANGVSGHTDWILEAKVWGHEAGHGEVIEQIEFHVHPE